MYVISGNVYYCQPQPIAVATTKKAATKWIKSRGYKWSSYYSNYVGMNSNGESCYLRLDNITVIGE